MTLHQANRKNYKQAPFPLNDVNYTEIDGSLTNSLNNIHGRPEIVSALTKS